MTAIVVTGKEPYTVQQRLGGTSTYSVYLAHAAGAPKIDLMLKIAASEDENGTLEREAYLLTTLRDRAADLEKEYARKYPGTLLNYQLGFPNLIDSFRAESQGDRRVLILSFDAVECVHDLVSLTMIRERDKVRVDPKTSAWILGKSLKILAFAHTADIEVQSLTGNDILINAAHHLVTFFDWSLATRHQGGLPRSVIRNEIKMLAVETISLLGGDLRTGTIPESEQLTDDRYADFLNGLARGRFTDASEAHSAFYQLVEALWQRKFHPYTTYPL